MANISQEKRKKMLEFLEHIRQEHNDDISLIAINEIENALTDKKYGIVWEEHSEQIDEELQTSIPVFEEDVARKITSSENLPFNFILEGDNLYSLKLLKKTHKNKIDVIYIDPPYNTGSNDFVYNDRIVDTNDLFYHSKWISFMHERLLVMQSLLSETGVIFISIDDHELGNLRLLCDEVFREENLIAMAIHKNNSNKNQSKLVGISTEYVLIYAKNKSKLMSKYNNEGWKVRKIGASDIKRKFDELKAAGVSLEQIREDIKDMYKRPKYAHLSRWNKVNEHGVFKDADLSRANGPKDYTIINPITQEKCKIPERGWGKSYDELLRLQAENMIWYGDDNTPPGMISYITGDDVSVPDSFWYYDNSIDTKFLRKIFGYDAFNNPKPVEMIKFILEMIQSKDALVLDAFAGSGTTGQAVLEMNKIDSGNRKFILCTDNSVPRDSCVKFLVEKHLLPAEPKKNTNKHKVWKESYESILKSSEFKEISKSEEYQKLGLCKLVTYERCRMSIEGKDMRGEKFSEGLCANLKYFKVKNVDKQPKNYFLSDALCLHIKEMIELQNHINVDNVKDVLILNRDDFNNTISNPQIAPHIERVWINQNIVFTSNEMKNLSKYDYKYIPKEFFGEEIREAGE